MVAPAIDTLTLVDASRTTLSVPIVLCGADALAAAATIGATTPVEPDAVHVSPPLPPLGALTLAVHVYAIDTSSDDRDSAFWHHFQKTRWLVIASQGPAVDRSWPRLFEQLTRAMDAHRTDARVALWGPASIAEAWRAYGGREPIAHADDWKTLLKPLLRDAVSALRS